MRSLSLFAAALVGAALAAPVAPAQTKPATPDAAGAAAHSGPAAVDLEWTPPALAELGRHAQVKSEFTLDRSMLASAVGLVPDADDGLKQAAAKLDGISVHVLRFSGPAVPDPVQLDALRDAYHMRGFKHLVNETATGGATPGEITDIWLAMDGSNVRGGVVLVQSAKTLTLVTAAGNLSPLDILHLRGHFGIPRFEGDHFSDAHGQ
jgi:hypothetical protein